MKLNEDVVPSTITAAVEQIMASLSDEDRAFIISSNSSAEVHHTIGRFLRNSWSLWAPDSLLKRDAAITYGIAHPDDISGLILDWVYRLVKGLSCDPQVICARFHEHWKAAGTDSLTAGNWPPENK